LLAEYWFDGRLRAILPLLELEGLVASTANELTETNFLNIHEIVRLVVLHYEDLKF